MGFGLIIAGFVLLVNPVINVFDVIPDAIGFALIVAGLTKLAYFVDGVSKARSMFFKLTLVELLKIASIFLIVGDVNSGSTKVLLSFVFGLAEAIMFTIAAIRLFEGISFSGLLYHGTNVHGTANRSGKKKDALTKTRNFIIFFYIFRCVATLVPELTELQMYDYIGTVHSVSRPLTFFKPPLYVLFGIITVILGVICAVKIAKYFGGLAKDKTYCDTFRETYLDARENRPSFFLAHRMMTSLMLLIAAAFSSFVILIDEVNLMIGAISALFFAASAIVMHKYVPKSNVILPFVVLRCASAVASFILQLRYFDEYSVEAIAYVDKAAAQFNLMAAVTALDMALAAALLIVYSVVLIGAVRDHLKVCGIIEETAQYSKTRRDAETFSLLKGKIITMAVLGTLYFISAAVYRFVELELEVYIVVFSVMAIVHIAYTVYAVSSVNSNLYEKETV